MEVVGVSTDSQETADRFRESLDLPFPLVGDPDAVVTSAYKAKWPLLRFARRVSYVIGKDGRVQRAYAAERDVDAHVQGACAVALQG